VARRVVKSAFPVRFRSWPAIVLYLSGFPSSSPALGGSRIDSPGGSGEGAAARVYEYDVFISYLRTASDISAWIRHHFHPRLLEVLGNNRYEDVRIFFDDQVRVGSSWPAELSSA